MEDYVVSDLILYLTEQVIKDRVKSERVPEPEQVKLDSEPEAFLPSITVQNQASSVPPDRMSDLRLIIDMATEKHLTNADAVAVSRLAYSANIAALVQDNSKYIGIILHLAELLGIKIEENKFVNNQFYVNQVEVNGDSKLTHNQLLDVAAKARSALSMIKNDCIAANNKVAALNNEIDFQKGRAKSLELRLAEAEAAAKAGANATKHINKYVLYSENRKRYIYIDKSQKSISGKASRRLNSNSFFETPDEALESLILVRKSIKKWWSYKIVRLALGDEALSDRLKAIHIKYLKND
jgi:hypothetical protein